MATCRQSPYLHKPAIIIVTSFSLWRLARTALAAPGSHYDVICYWAGHAQRGGRRYIRTYGHLTWFNV